MTDAEIDDLETLAKAATPGRWVRWLDVTISAQRDNRWESPHVAVADFVQDADYIAAACPQKILALIHTLRDCRSKIRGYEQQESLSLKNGEI